MISLLSQNGLASLYISLRNVKMYNPKQVIIADLKASRLSVVKYRNSIINIDASGRTNVRGILKIAIKPVEFPNDC